MTMHAVPPRNVNRPGSTLTGVPGIAPAIAFFTALVAVLLLIIPSAAARPTAEVAATYQVTLSVGAAPYTYQLVQGSSVTLPIEMNVTGALPLSAISALIQYNPTELRPTTCVARADGPGGYCNAVYDPAAGLVRFNVLAGGTGVMGTATLFDITFETAPSPKLNQSNPVTPLIESVADAQGNTMTSQAIGSAIRVLKPATTGAVVYVGMPEQAKPFEVTRGLTTTVPVWLTGVTDLGSATFSLAFNPAVVRPLACRPIQTSDGSAFGTCALHDDRVSANLLAPAGLSGAAAAFEVDFTAVGTGSSPLSLTIEAFNAPSGTSIPMRIVNQSISVSSASGPALPLLRIEPATQNLYGDARVSVHVFLDRGTELAAGSWGIRYNSSVLQAETCQFSAGLQNAVCNATGEPGLVRLTVLATEPLATTTDIATVTFRRHPEAHGGLVSSLQIEVFNFANLVGDQLPYSTQGGQIQLYGELSGGAQVLVSFTGAPAGGYTMAAGASLNLPITLSGIAPDKVIGSLSGTVRYDPAVLRPTRCQRAAADLAFMGYCNAQHDPAAGIVRFNLVSAEGLSGTLTPFTLTFEAASTASAGNLSPLNLNLDTITGPLGEPRTWQANDSSLLITPPIAAARVLIGPPAGTGLYIFERGVMQTLPVWVDGVTGLGTATVTFRFDRAVVRAIGCRLRSDLIPGATGGFCFIAPDIGTIRANLLVQQGFSGSAQFLEIDFTAASLACDIKTGLTINVENFVSTAELPIASTARHGELRVPCIAPATPTPSATPTHTPTATSTPTATPIVSLTPTSTATPVRAAHIGDLDASVVKGKRDWQASVTILVHDQAHQPAGSAKVAGEFSNAPGVIRSCTTVTGGTCTITVTKLPLTLTTMTFTVTSVTHTTLPYDATANHDPESDSNGTSIIINQVTLAPMPWIGRVEGIIEGIRAMPLGE